MKNTRVTDIMTVNPESIGPSQAILDIKHIYEKKNFHHHIPVVQDEKLVGMVSLLDFMYRIGNAGLEDSSPVYSNLLVRDIMSQNPESLDVNSSIEDTAKILAKGEFHSVPILQNNRLAGIVTSTDLIRHCFGIKG